MIFRNLIINNCWRRRKILQTRAYTGRGSASTSPLNWGRSPPFLELRPITHLSNHLKLRSEEHTKNSLQCCNLIFPFKYKEICLKERWNSTCKVIELYVYLVSIFTCAWYPRSQMFWIYSSNFAHPSPWSSYQLWSCKELQYKRINKNFQ